MAIECVGLIVSSFESEYILYSVFPYMCVANLIYSDTEVAF
jgi:hypothetical protein